MISVEKETLIISCSLMSWVPYSAMRNVRLRLSDVFSFNILFFSSQDWFIILFVSS